MLTGSVSPVVFGFSMICEDVSALHQAVWQMKASQTSFWPLCLGQGPSLWLFWLVLWSCLATSSCFIHNHYRHIHWTCV